MVWFHWKLHTKKEGNCSGRSRVRNLQGIFLDNWSRDRRNYKKIYRAVFGKMRNFWAYTKLRPKIVSKATECKLIKFFLLLLFLLTNWNYQETIRRLKTLSEKENTLHRNFLGCSREIFSSVYLRFVGIASGRSWTSTLQCDLHSPVPTRMTVWLAEQKIPKCTARYWQRSWL